MDKKCSIYCIRNTANNKRYIGSTINIVSRYSYHRSKLRRSIHENEHLQNAWNKYGEQSFEFSVIEECEISLRWDRELHYLQAHNTLDKQFGYNMAPHVNLPPMTEETKRKISRAMKGRKPWITGRHHSEATKKKISKSNTANNAMRGKTGDEHHFFGRKHTRKSKEKMSLAKLGRCNNHSSKAVVQLDEDEQVLQVFVSAREAERQIGVCSKNIAACLKGKRPRAGGFKWRYA